jgi:hypothetical protein
MVTGLQYNEQVGNGTFAVNLANKWRPRRAVGFLIIAMLHV